MFTSNDNDTIIWLMEGDPAVRWQTMRDLLDEPPAVWQAERQRTLQSGWVAQYLALQEPGGGWGGGVYSPKWISTTYTLLNLCSLGIPPASAAGQRGAHQVIDRMLGEQDDDKFRRALAVCDRCVVGMILQLAVYFAIEDARVEALVENLLDERMPDGGWNCRRKRDPGTHHSSFHTTFNVLSGLREYIERGGRARQAEVLAAEQAALELMLQHRLYQSDQTGETINPKFTLLSFPPRWHYDILRGLEYFARAAAPHDPRLEDALNLLGDKRRADGRWPVQQRYAGKDFFQMEKMSAPSRWNTLRALRVYRWWGK